MKVYLVASLQGKKQYQQNYEKIAQVLEQLGVEIVNTDFLTVNSSDLTDVTSSEEKKYYKNVQKWINKADVVIGEVSYRSTSVGHEVTLALSKNKPVILLHVKGKKPTLFTGIENDKLQLMEYEMENISEILKYALDYASDSQDTRFNFFISPKHQSYLDWIAKNKKIPRSVFLRRLIEVHMEQNEDYP